MDYEVFEKAIRGYSLRVRVQGTDGFTVPISRDYARELFHYCRGDLALFRDGPRLASVEPNAKQLYGRTGWI